MDDWERRYPPLIVTHEDVERLLMPMGARSGDLHLTLIKGGMSNTLYRVTLHNPETSWALKIHQREPDSWRREWTLSQRLRPAVPMPEVVLAGEDPDGGRFTWSLAEWVEGETLEAWLLGCHDADEAEAVGAAVGDAAARIASFPFHRAGFLDANLEPLPSWDGWSEPFYHHLMACLDGDAGGLLGPERASRVRASVEVNWPRLDPVATDYRLVHSDFRPANLILRAIGSTPPKIVVVDWDFVHAGTPLADIGNLLRHDELMPPGFLQGVERGYRDAGGTLPAEWRFLARLVDLVALCDVLNSCAGRPRVAEDFIHQIFRTVSGTDFASK